LIKIKNGVDVKGLKPETVLAILIAEPIYNKYHSDLVITSVRDGTHRADSRHFRGDAVDFRIKDLDPMDVSEVTVSLSRALGAQFDVVRESDHIHVEFDPESTRVATA